MHQRILVTSSTGKIGTELVHLLASSGRTVVCATRDPESPRAHLLQSFGPGLVHAVRFDVDDEPSMRAAFDGVTGLAVIAPFAPDMEAWHQRVVDVAVAQKTVRMIAKVSVTGARSPDTDPPPGGIPLQHFKGEEVCRRSGIPSLAVRPTIFAQHFLGMSPALYRQGQDTFWLPTGDAPVAWLDCRDIAACLAAALTLDDDGRQRWANQAFELTGPEGLRAEQLAERLSQVAGRAIRWVDGEPAFVERCAELGVPDRVKGIYAEAAGGWFGDVHHDEFTALTGRRPTSFAKFVADHAAHFEAAPRS